MKAFTRSTAVLVLLFGWNSAQTTFSRGTCEEESTDYASAIQKRSQMVDRSTSVLITEEALARKGREVSDSSGNVEKSVSSKGSGRRRARKKAKVNLEKRYDELNSKLINLIEDAVVAHGKVQDAFSAQVVEGVDALRDAALAADRAMLSTHAELVETLDKLEKQWEDKVYTLTVAAGEAKQKLEEAAADARDELQQRVDEAQDAYNAARQSWRLWQDRYQEAQMRIRDQLDEFALLLETRKDIVQRKYESLLQAAVDAQQKATEKLEDAVDAALDAATQKLVDAAVEAEERRVAMLTHYRNVVFDLRKKADQLQARLEEANQKRRELEARAEVWAKKVRETAETVVEKVREAQDEFVAQVKARVEAVKLLVDKVKSKLDFLRETAKAIDTAVQNTVYQAVNQIQSHFNAFTDALKETQDKLKQTVTDELKKREKEMIAVVAEAEKSLKEAIVDLETMVVAKVEAKVAEADAALREVKANVDAATESVKRVADDLKEQAQQAVDDLRALEADFQTAKDDLVLQLQEAQSEAKKIETELKNIVADVAETAVEAAQKAVSAVDKLFKAFRLF